MPLLLLAIVALMPFMAFAELDSYELCQKYSVGVHRIKGAVVGQLLAVSRADPLIEDDDGLQRAIESAEMRAKAKLAKYKNNESLAGVVRLFSCVKDGYAYVGVVWSSDAESKAKLLRKAIAN